MTPKQAKLEFGIKGTKRLRKQWGIAVARGKDVFTDFLRIPNFNPDKIIFTREQKILKRINAKLARQGY